MSMSSTLVLVNGIAIGTVAQPDRLLLLVKAWRQAGRFPHELGISRVRGSLMDEVRMFTDAGRLMTYYLTVDQVSGRLNITERVIQQVKRAEVSFDQLMRDGFVIMLCSQGVANMRVAFSVTEIEASVQGECSHFDVCVLHPAGIFGISAAASIPRAQHNNPLRTMFQSNMGKAAIGVVDNVQHWGTEAQTVQLAYPQTDLNQPFIAKTLGMGNDAQNALLAVVCSPNTMEDSYLVNAAAIERGLFCRYADRFYKAMSNPVDPNQVTVGSCDRIGLPLPTDVHYGSERFSHLDADGMVKVGQQVEPGMVLIAVHRVTNNRSQDVSIVQRYGERGVVNKVVIAEGAKPGSVCVTVVVRSWLPLTVGDKISTMGQSVQLKQFRLFLFSVLSFRGHRGRDQKARGHAVRPGNWRHPGRYHQSARDEEEHPGIRAVDAPRGHCA